MVSPLRLLRNWLSFGDRQTAATDLASIQGWLEHHTSAPAAEMAAGLASRIPALVAKETNLHKRLRLLDTLATTAEDLLPNLENEIGQAALPLAASPRAAAAAADRLLKSLATGYDEMITTIESRRLAGGLNRLLQAALLRAILASQRRQALAYRIYAVPSAAAWQQLHQWYQLARSRGLAESEESREGVGTAYVRALLLATADPCKHPRQDVPALVDICKRVAPLARIRDAASLSVEEHQGRALFLLQPNGASPTVPLSRGIACPADGLVMDAGGAVRRLQQELAQGKADPQAKELITLWNGPAGRRFTRARFKPRADLVTGVPAVAGYLHGAFARRKGDLRQAQAPAASEWYIVNQSPDGFGLRHTQGETGNLDVGDLVGLRPRERSRVHICLIRRVSNTGPGRFELGLQELSPLALPIPLEGGDGILLPRLPGFGNGAGLAAPGGLLKTGSEVTWSRNGRSFRHLLARRIHANRHIDLFLLA